MVYLFLSTFYKWLTSKSKAEKVVNNFRNQRVILVDPSKIFDITVPGKGSLNLH